MSLKKILEEGRQEMLEEAVESVRRARLEGYEKAGIDLTRKRLGVLLDLVIAAVLERNLAPIITHANAVATERFEAGVDLSEVQTAFNVLEEVIWLRILKKLPAAKQAEALGLVGTVLGSAKDSLARKYVSMATQTHTPSLNLKALFLGSDTF
jgi:phage baseplate assembly protein W